MWICTGARGSEASQNGSTDSNKCIIIVIYNSIISLEDRDGNNYVIFGIVTCKHVNSTCFVLAGRMESGPTVWRPFVDMECTR